MSIGREIIWRLSIATQDKFKELVVELEMSPLGSDRYYQLLDELRSLPGFPHNADPEHDLIRLDPYREHLN